MANKKFTEEEMNHLKVSPSAKGCPYDNAVAEAQFKIIKTEFVRFRRFESLEHLRTELAAYVYWFNNKRIHGTLGYKSPVTLTMAEIKKMQKKLALLEEENLILKKAMAIFTKE